MSVDSDSHGVGSRCLVCPLTGIAMGSRLVHRYAVVHIMLNGAQMLHQRDSADMW